MRAMILAAGLGARMGGLTQAIPKPLVKVGSQSLIEYPLRLLEKAGISDVIINTHYKSELLKKFIGAGAKYNLRIEYSDEEELLNTGGGVLKALPFFENKPFILISSDIICDYPLQEFTQHNFSSTHLVYVPNPYFKATGDVSLENSSAKRSNVLLPKTETFTYASFGVIHPNLFAGESRKIFSLQELFLKAINEKKITGEVYHGSWYNVGTQQDILLAQKELSLPNISFES